MFNINEPVITITMTEKWVWDCPNVKDAFYEAKHNTLTTINDRINWCMAEIERLKSLEILDSWDLERYAAEMKYLQTTVSDCMLNFFHDLEYFIDMKPYLSEPYSHLCDKWRFADEALALIGDEQNGI